MKKILTLDVENCMYKHQEKNEEGRYNPRDRLGSAFCLPQFLVLTGLKWMHEKDAICIENDVKCIQKHIDNADIIVGFNIKHDLHWLRRVGIDLSSIRIRDCQLAEFLLEAQQNPYPSLNGTCEKYGFPPKLDVIEEEYWSKGIDTDEIPLDILSEYLKGDLDRTERIFIKQCEQFGVRL